MKTIYDFLCSKIHDTSIVSFASKAGWLQNYDVNFEDDKHVWGYELGHQLLLHAKLNNPSNYPLGIEVRTFLKDTVKCDGMMVPKKSIRAYFAKSPTEIRGWSSDECKVMCDSHRGDMVFVDTSSETLNNEDK